MWDVQLKEWATKTGACTKEEQGYELQTGRCPAYALGVRPGAYALLGEELQDIKNLQVTEPQGMESALELSPPSTSKTHTRF